VDLVEKLVHYPFPKIGLFAGRGFGGSSVFTLLKVHGSMRFYAFKEAKLGIMSDAVLDRVCANHPKHLKDWEETKKIHRSDMSDLVEAGVIDQVLQRSEFRSVIVRDLLSQPHYIPKQENKGYPHGINPQ
jgi:acetyl-CoA carboxylase carboxyltransferase component